jgi:hypothetical protein
MQSMAVIPLREEWKIGRVKFNYHISFGPHISALSLLPLVISKSFV